MLLKVIYCQAEVAHSMSTPLQCLPVVNSAVRPFQIIFSCPVFLTCFSVSEFCTLMYFFPSSGNTATRSLHTDFVETAQEKFVFFLKFILSLEKLSLKLTAIYKETLFRLTDLL